MSNTQTAFGFRHIGFLSGAGPDYQQATRLVQSTNTTKIFFGDPVVKSGAYIVRAASGTTAPAEGIFYGCSFIPSTGVGLPQWSPYWPGAAAADATAYIVNAPNALFLAATLATAVVTTNIGDGISFDIGTGSTVGGGLSGATLDFTTLTTATTAMFQVYSMYQGIGNGSDNGSNYNWVVVTFNNQRFKSLAGVT